MKLVIDIPEEVYTFIRNVWKDVESDKRSPFSELCKAVENGKPLPKGHGDLIDRKELLKQPMDNVFYPSNYVRIAPPIIEADKESTE